MTFLERTLNEGLKSAVIL